MSDLQQFHHAEEAQSSTFKYVVAAVIIILMGGFAIWVYESGILKPPPQAVSDSRLPK